MRSRSSMPACRATPPRAGSAGSTGRCRTDTDAVILELGANDALRGVDPKVTKAALDAILGKLDARHIPVLLAGMARAAQHGRRLCARVRRHLSGACLDSSRRLLSVLPRRASPPIAKLNQGDGLHPNAGRRRCDRGAYPAEGRSADRPRRACASGSLGRNVPCRVFSPASKSRPTIGQALSMLRGGLPGARWIDPENYHLTLRFIGDVDDVTAHEVASMLDRVKRGGSICISTACRRSAAASRARWWRRSRRRRRCSTCRPSTSG